MKQILAGDPAMPSRACPSGEAPTGLHADALTPAIADGRVLSLIRALREIQKFDGGYERAWKIAEAAINAAGFASGLAFDEMHEDEL